MQQIPPDNRGRMGMDMWEQEQMKRLNPYGPARPSWSQRTEGPLTWRARMSLLWSRLRAVWPLGRRQKDGAHGN